MTVVLAVTMILYVAAMFAIGFWARGRIRNDEDYIVAGRRLPFHLSTATLLATWFGAGTLLVAADEVKAEGLRVTALEPVGAGICLILAGLFYARPLWESRLLTLSDFYRLRFGRTAEVISVFYQVSFLGWIAAQLVSLAHILDLFFAIPVPAGICLVAAVAVFYTWLGGMWSVTLTDFVQVAILLAGLAILALEVLGDLGGGRVSAGLERLGSELDGEALVFVPVDRASDFFKWLSLFLAGSIGNIPYQDLMQRVFSSRTARTASASCIAAGCLYIAFGALPVILGLAGRLLLPSEVTNSVIPALAERHLTIPLAVVFVLTLLSAVLSTLDSALLAPASVFAQNLVGPLLRGKLSALALTRVFVLAVAALSVALALSGEGAYELLESSYSLGLAPLVVLTFGLYARRHSPVGASCVLALGLAAWVLESLWPLLLPGSLEETLGFPLPPIVLAVSLCVYGGALLAATK